MTVARRVEDDPPVARPQTPHRAIAEARVLRPVSGRPPMAQYLRDLWRHRHFITERAWSLAITQNRGFLLGNLWMVVQPLIDAGIYLAIFGFIFKADIPDFPSFIVIGVFMFLMSNRDITAAATCIRSNQGLIRAFMFPRAAVPLASVLRNLVETVPTVVVMTVIVCFAAGFPGPSLLLMPLLFSLHLVFDLGLACMVARLGAVFPDFQKLIPLAFRILLYTSGVVFPAHRYDAIPLLAMLVHHNPFFLLLDMYRDLLMRHTVPPAGEWFWLVGWALGTLVLGFVIFWRGEVTYGRSE